jgi:hypothetical protein
MRLLICTASVAAALCWLPASCLAAAPANDNFANAQDVGALPATASANNTDATSETGEPAQVAGGPFHSVWFKWTSGAAGPTKVDFCDSSVFPWFSVYTGTDFSNLQPVAHNSFWSNQDCAQTFKASADTTYYVVADSFGTYGDFNLTVRPANPPPNDDFADALAIGPGSPVDFAGSNLDATAESGEPHHANSNGVPDKSVWYRWVAPRDTEATFQRDCGIDTTDDVGVTISVYTGTSLGDLQQVGGTVCFQTISVTRGTTYWIAANGLEEGTFHFTITVPTPPPNDDFTSAEVLPSGLQSHADGTTVNSSYEDLEPDHFTDLPAYTSVWYRWTATTSGLVSADTCDSDFDSVLAVYNGNSFGQLTQLGSSDDATACDTDDTNPYGSAVTFNATAGTEYRIAVDGYDEGYFTLNLQAAGPQTGPVMSGPPVHHKKRCGKAKAAKKKCRKKRHRVKG